MNNFFKSILGRRFFTVMFEVTTRCNHNCIHCYNIWKNFPKYPTGELDTKKTIELLDIIIDSTGIKQLGITGGEPTLRLDLEDIVAHAKKRKVRVNLLTNGSLLTDERVRSLIAAGVNMFQLPILGGVEHLHNEMSAYESFRQVLHVMQFAKKNGAKVVGVFVVTKKNLYDLAGVVKICVGLDIDGLLLNRLSPTGLGKENLKDLRLSKEDMEYALTLADKSVEKYGLQIFLGTTVQPCIIDHKKFKNLTFPVCPVGKTNSYYTIDPIGNLRPCNNTPHILGNLFEKSFREMHKGEELKDFAKAYPKFCEPCKKKDKCQGGCKACAYVCYGDIRESEPFLKDNAEEVRFF